MVQGLILWGHAIASLLFALLAASQFRARAAALPRATFIAALSITAFWALAVAGIGAADLTPRVIESIRNLAWLGFMLTLVRRDRSTPAVRAVTGIYGVVALVVAIGTCLAIVETAVTPAVAVTLGSARILLRLMVAVSALVLVDHLYAAVAPRARGGIRLAVLALAAMWSIDAILYANAWFTGQWSPALIAGRGIVMALTVPLLAVAVQRNADWTLQLSRTVAWQTVALAATLLYGAAMLLATGAIGAIGGDHARVWQTAFVFGSSAAALTLLSSPWLRAWAKVKLAKHFFRHRYDYRHEWLRFTDTLGSPGDSDAPLEKRMVKAIADLVDAPGGALLVPDGDGLGAGARWRWPDAPEPGEHGPSLTSALAATDRIIELDALRRDGAQTPETAAVPAAILASAEAWVLVPLHHLGRLQGAILLARPVLDRALDWEDFDLLRVSARHVASHLAEARAQDALSEAQRFDEFNRRFAFIMHDIKNLVSQLTLVARNAERHADNPAFRADMIATLQDSAGRMNGMLARLSQHHLASAEPARSLDLYPIAVRLAGRRRGQHPVTVAGFGSAFADPVRLEQLLDHLVQNAIDASPVGYPVTIELSRATITVADCGSGMSAAFVRDRLFKPFVSSKPDGFGIGAFEARQLAESMGGRIDVESREGCGSRFVVTLPPALEQAA